MTAKDLADLLVRANATHGQTAWLMKQMMGAFRRLIIKPQDALVFRRETPGIDDRLLLQVFERGSVDPTGGPLNVFGEPQLLLEFIPPGTGFQLTDAFVATAYGRKMAFGIASNALRYEAMFLGAPHGNPDEGGEGEPTTPP